MFATRARMTMNHQPVSLLQRLLLSKKKQQELVSAAAATKSSTTPYKTNKFLKEVRTFSTASSSTSLTEREDDDNSHVVTIPKWDVPMMQSKGDYREEASVEQQVGGNLYKYQSSLPRLPIPAVSDTIEKLLPTILPLARTPQEADAVKSACMKFPGQAEVLQQRLIERRDNEQKDSSWLQPWWNTLGYLQVRDSVVINVSYFFAFVDDETVQLQPTAVPANVQRAAAMMYVAGEFRKEVVSGNLPAELLGRAKIPLDSTAYRYMFNACRIPDQSHDSYRIYDPSRHSHMIVVRKGQFFAVDFVDEMGDPFPVEDLQDQLLRCIEMAESSAGYDGQQGHAVNLGILTSTNRTSWADNREKLLSLGGVAMEEALKELESGAFVVNLDDTDPQTLDEHSEMLLTGGAVSADNRWFDKSLQLIVANNGKAGLLSEHSLMDGMPVTRFADYITKTSAAEIVERSRRASQDKQAANNVEPPRNIFGNVLDGIDTDTLKVMENEARDEHCANVNKQDSASFVFDGYGSSHIKSCGHAPDAFAQVAMQLATYRLFGEQAGTYEATQVRKFLHGRTEVTRAVTSESGEFLKAMGFERGLANEQLEEKRTLLQDATMAHSKFSKQASDAQGVDRHLFGLQMMVQDNEEVPALLTDPVFQRGKKWRVSTSNLSHPKFCNWGYGQVVPDGVGLSYSIHPNSIVFNVTSLKETGWSNQLTDLLQDVLNVDMPALLDNQLPKSKL
mmetsp:Transcript_45811/g.111705  ORF Transcript_45811/g.111705 Transcript_45811/m.111705 type:complete len:732 (+) Transcript_45811:417-2612(+)